MGILGDSIVRKCPKCHHKNPDTKQFCADCGTQLPSLVPGNQGKVPFSHKVRTIFFIVQILFVLALLIVWISSETLQKSKNLWVFFFYTFPSNFLIAVVPYDPAILYFGKFHPAFSVTLVAIIGTLLTEAINYYVLKFIRDISSLNKIMHSKFVRKIIGLFNKSPFLALVIAAFTPIPFYPFRFLVVFARYPMVKYLLAVFVGRTPRLFLIAFFGNILNIPDRLFLILFIGLTIILYFPFVRYFKKKKQT